MSNECLCESSNIKISLTTPQLELKLNVPSDVTTSGDMDHCLDVWVFYNAHEDTHIIYIIYLISTQVTRYIFLLTAEGGIANV